MYSPFSYERDKPTVWTLKKEIKELKEEIIDLKVEFDNFENGLANRINDLFRKGRLNVERKKLVYKPGSGQ